mgnify:CR=1 FL=1
MPHARKLDNQTMPSQQPRFSKTVTDDEHKTTSTATGNTRGKIMLHPELDMDEMDFEVGSAPRANVKKKEQKLANKQ